MLLSRLKTTFILLSFLGHWSHVLAQSSMGHIKVTVNCTDQSLRHVLEDIKEQTNIKFVYSDVIVDGEEVSCQFEDLPLEEALKRITEQNDLSFKFHSAKWIVLFRKIDGLHPDNEIQGRVMADTSKIGLDGADVFLSGTAIGTSTDENGEFSISNIPIGYYDLECRHIGYETEVLQNIAITENTRIQHNINTTLVTIHSCLSCFL